MPKRNKNRRRKQGRRKTVLLCIALGLTIGVGAFFLLHGRDSGRVNQQGELRGIWLSYVDFKDLGLYNQSEEQFRRHADTFLQQAKGEHCNAIFLQVRMFDDALWPSKTFPMDKFLWDKAESIPYDPLKVMVEQAHKQGIALHAWLNPYRIQHGLILNPAAPETTQRILQAVGEILKGYPVDGIHFDDYFYQNSMKGGGEADAVDRETKSASVNHLVKAVRKLVKDTDPTIRFGISPQGNVENCRDAGADVDTWLSGKTGEYVDYLAPQLYWTDKHSATWRRNMFTDTLHEWKSLNKNDTILYIGLAAYRTGFKQKDDPGWNKDADNLARQLKELRQARCGGYILFSAKDLLRTKAQPELQRFRAVVEGKDR